MSSSSVEVRSVSPRTVFASEKATAASAAEIQSTISSALPRVAQTIVFRGLSFLAKPRLIDDKKRSSVLLEVAIRDLRVPVHVDRRDHTDGLQPRGVRIERRHLDTHRLRPRRPDEAWIPAQRQRLILRLIQISETGE